jgi:hypothetical protein
MVEHEFELDDDTWEAWIDAIRASSTPDERLTELIEADLDGRIQNRHRGIPEMNSENQTAPIEPGVDDQDPEE